MKEKFIKRYKEAVLNYFYYNGDREGELIRNYIVGEYEKILNEEFDISKQEIREMYDELYLLSYDDGQLKERPQIGGV